MDLISELKWRGLYKDTTDLDKLKKVIENTDPFYLGIDPTADSIHIGHLLSIELLRILSSHNMKPFLLIGGATASIGDPSGKTAERKVIRSKELVHNINSLTNQIEDIYNRNKKSFGNNFKILNNLEWYQNLDLIKFLRDYGKHINIASMISKDNVKKRIETGISFTEFSYQLMQGFDYLHLRDKYGVKLQIGGSDQWGNIVTGTELIRKSLKKDDVVGMTVNLLLDKSGNKIGKTSSGEVIWLSENKTSSFKLHQYLRSQSDDMAMDLVKKLTLISKSKFEELLKLHNQEPKKRIFQNFISNYLISFLGHKTTYDVVIKVSNAIFS
ncbi:MAG: tyrosine--tRNA ligase, partial [Mycoplasmataceae bacterium]|nr:tyrosine--tRNA ligase [Mycoplasmataceae bacterium]